MRFKLRSARFHQQAIILVGVCWILFVNFTRAADDQFLDQFNVPKDHFTSQGKNNYCIVQPGWYMVFEGTEDGQKAQLIVTVLGETKMIDEVETRVVEERETVNGQLSEISRNFMAVDKATNDIYYFGEETDKYKDGKVAGHDGSWQAGKDGARFGLFMPARPKVGQKFIQELAPKVAMDRVEILSLSETVEVPAGRFDNCVKTEDTSPLEPDSKEQKFYAPEVGLLMDGGLKLVRCGK